MTSINSNINLFLGLQAQLRIFHWQTKGYARHNAFGVTYDTLEDLIDTFVEEAMGKYGRFVLDDETNVIQLTNLKELKPEAMLDTVILALNQFSEQFEETDTNLLNVRDEMLGAINKLKYLLTLE
jgi:DNA-binding ferritin-like protein